MINILKHFFLFYFRYVNFYTDLFKVRILHSEIPLNEFFPNSRNIIIVHFVDQYFWPATPKFRYHWKQSSSDDNNKSNHHSSTLNVSSVSTEVNFDPDLWHPTFSPQTDIYRSSVLNLSHVTTITITSLKSTLCVWVCPPVRLPVCLSVTLTMIISLKIISVYFA